MDTVRAKLDIPAQNDELLLDNVAIQSRTELEQYQTTDIATDAPSIATTWEMRIDPESGPATIPATCVKEVTAIDGLDFVQSADCISQGRLTLAQAQTCFEIYAYRLDHFLYRILGESPSLQQMRSSSALLTAAICAVGALHSQELAHLFEPCQKSFLQQCASLLFSKSTNIDDIRGLCIGAFWLHDISWQLVGLGEYVCA
jgi:hypothetical protein